MSKWQKHLPIEIGSFIIKDASFESMSFTHFKIKNTIYTTRGGNLI
jgi:hypothetical protein